MPAIDKIAVIGVGHVGINIIERFEPVVQVVSYDPARDAEYPSAELATCDLGVICVPTPPLPDGSCDISIVEQAIADLPVDLIWVRSTVAPGTCDQLAAKLGKQICFSPELVGETNFSDAYDLDDFLIIGGEPQARERIVELANRVAKPPSKIYECTNAESELVKYMENTFLAVKVGLVADYYELSQKLGLDWDTVREAWLADPRMGEAHSHATPGDLGFGGKCLPKDLDALCQFGRANGMPLPILEAARDANIARRPDLANGAD